MAVESLELQVSVTGVSQGASQLDRLTKSAQSSVNVLKFLRNALVLASSIRLFSGFFDLIDTFQRMQQQLTLVTGSIQDTGAAMQVVFGIAQQARAPLDAVNTLFQRIVRVGGNLNYTYGQVATVTKAVAQSFTIAGASAEETHNAIIQLTQGLNLGVLRGQDLRSVVEFNPVIAQAFADKLYQLGLSTDSYGKKIKLAAGQVYSFVTAHKNILTTKIALDAITESAAKWNEEIQKTPPTLGQLATNAKSAFTYIIGTLGQVSGLFTGLDNILLTINQNLGAIIGVVAAVGAAFAGWLILDFITLQFAKLFELRGVFGFILSPITNIARAFVNLYGVLSSVVSLTASVAVGLYNAAAGAAKFSGEAAKLIGKGIAEWFKLLDTGLLAFTNGISFAISAVTNFGTASVSVFSRLIPFFALVIENAGELAVLLGKDLVAAAGQLGTAIVSGLASAAVSALAAIPAILLTVLALIPVLLVGVVGITAAFGGLVSLGAGLTSIGDTINGISQKTASWHDILNSFIKFALTAFDILANHLPLVMAVIGEQWNNLVATFTAGLVKLYTGLDTYLVSPLLTVLKIMTTLIPLLSTLAGAGIGGLVGGPVGAVIGGFAGLAAGTIGGFKIADAIKSVETGWQQVGDRARQVASEAGMKAGHTYTDELSQVISDDMKKYGKGDFLKALNLLGQGLDLKTVAKQTGVQIGDLSKVQSIAGFLGKTVPQHGQLSGTGENSPNTRTSDALQQLANSVSKYADPVDKYQNILDKTSATITRLTSAHGKLGPALTQTQVAAVFAAQGFDDYNAKTQTSEKFSLAVAEQQLGLKKTSEDLTQTINLAGIAQDLLNKQYDKGVISAARYADETQQLADKVLQTQIALAQNNHTVEGGIQTAVLQMRQALSNPNPIAAEAITSATSIQTTLQKAQISYQALTKAAQDGTISAQQFDRAYRDLQITVLDTQTTFEAGFERGLLKLQKDFSDTAAASEQVMTDAFKGISDGLTNLLTGGSFDLKTFSQNVFKSFANVLSRDAVGSLLNSVTQNGTNGNVLGKVAQGLGLGGAIGSSAANPMFVTITSGDNPLGNAGNAITDALDLGGVKLRGSIIDGMQTGTNSFSSAISNLFGSGGSAGASGGGLLGNLGSAVSGIFSKGGVFGSGGFVSSLLDTVGLGFATEGQFQVGGQGGMDSQIVPVRATPGEVVSVSHGQPTEAQANANANANKPNIVNMTVVTQDVNSFKRSQSQVFGRVRRGIAAAGRNE